MAAEITMSHKKTATILLGSLSLAAILATGAGIYWWQTKPSPVPGALNKTEPLAGTLASEPLGFTEPNQIQIPEPETPKPTEPEIPKGFGLGEPADAGKNNEPPTPAEKPAPTPEETAVALETPNDLPNKVSPTVEKTDPRTVGITANEGPEKDFEETILTVQRTLTAVMPNGDKQLIRLKIPVMYRSRTLRLEGETQKEAMRILTNLQERKAQLHNLQSALEKDLQDWNKLVMETSPYSVLLPESPSIPQNQSATKLNREENPNMAPGKAISYEIVTPNQP